MRALGAMSTAVAAFVVAVADIPENLSARQPATLVATAIASAALAARHRIRPTGAVLGLVSLVMVAVGAELAGQPGQISFGHYAVLALLIADVVRQSRPPVAAVVVAGALATSVITEGLADDRGAADVAFVAMMWSFAASTALAIRWRTVATAARDERVQTLERERIARELHDTIAHHVSAIALTSEGARTFVGADDARVDRALDAINGAAGAALDDMREMVAILRDGRGTDPPVRLDALVASLASAGPPRVDVRVDVDHEPPAALSAAVHRIAREAVTNARRHARDATAVTVTVSEDGALLLVTVADDGRASTARPGAGFGIAGMSERATLLGGSCHAGPGSHGGWQVVARLPMERVT